MGNTIKRNTRVMEIMLKLNTSAFGEGEVVKVYRYYDQWVARDSGEQLWSIFRSHLNNENYCDIISQSSGLGHDKIKIANELLATYPDYYETVATEFIANAVQESYLKDCPEWLSLAELHENIIEKYI